MRIRGDRGAHIMLEDISGDEGFIDTRVFVRLQVLQCIVGNTLVLFGLCERGFTVSQAEY